MWSETFTDSYGWRWSFRRMREWETVQLLVSPPEEQHLTLEPFSYGFKPDDLDELARILDAARARGRGGSEDELRLEPAPPSRYEEESLQVHEDELAAGRDPRD